MVADTIETDVQRCVSGELMVFHKEMLNRMTDATGEVASTPLLPLEEPSALNTAESIPYLTEVFEVAPLSVGLNLELDSEAIESGAADIVDWYGHEVIVSSFDLGEVTNARDTSAALVANLPYANADAGDEFDTTAAPDVTDGLDCSYVHLHFDLCLGSV